VPPPPGNATTSKEAVQPTLGTVTFKEQWQNIMLAGDQCSVSVALVLTSVTEGN
jgi:hypothetical protein